MLHLLTIICSSSNVPSAVCHQLGVVSYCAKWLKYRLSSLPPTFPILEIMGHWVLFLEVHRVLWVLIAFLDQLIGIFWSFPVVTAFDCMMPGDPQASDVARACVLLFWPSLSLEKFSGFDLLVLDINKKYTVNLRRMRNWSSQGVSLGVWGFDT